MVVDIIPNKEYKLNEKKEKSLFSSFKSAVLCCSQHI